MSVRQEAVNQAGQEPGQPFTNKRVKSTTYVFSRVLGEFQTAFLTNQQKTKQKQAKQAASTMAGSDKLEASSDDSAIDRFPAGLLTEPCRGLLEERGQNE